MKYTGTALFFIRIIFYKSTSLKFDRKIKNKTEAEV